MKNFKKLTAAVALTLGVGIAAPQVGAAPIELKRDGIGDALLYPAFVGFFENWFTVQNSSNIWLQGHIRFRGAAWSSELLDFDVILSPGDVMLFRLADVDGDGRWEIDQSLDPLNFQYTSINRNCSNSDTGAVTADCMDGSFALEPSAGVVSQGLLEHNRNVGYIEFIGECELRNMTGLKMGALLTAGSNLAALGMHANSRSGVSTRLGTNCWAWSDASNNFALDTNGPGLTYGLTDFPNAASGAGFIRLPGRAFGMGYTAEAFVNFRTETHPHRVDSYRIVGTTNLDAADLAATQRNRAVIVHDQNSNAFGGGASPFGHYVYRFTVNPGPGNQVESRQDEVLMSFNNTWGPSLWDGDDYDMSGTAQTIDGQARNIYDGVGNLRPVDITGTLDDWDQFYPAAQGDTNSIAEVEEAIRIGGQQFTSFYVDNANAFGGGSELTSWYFAHFPTKYYYGQSPVFAAASERAYINGATAFLLSIAKPVNIEIWDIFENTGGNSIDDNVSPAPLIIQTTVLGQELSIFNVDSFFKSAFPNTTDYASGRVVLSLLQNDPNVGLVVQNKLSWPGLAYTFEAGANLSELTHWRAMNR